MSNAAFIAAAAVFGVLLWIATLIYDVWFWSSTDRWPRR